MTGVHVGTPTDCIPYLQGFYATVMRDSKAAEHQFNIALRKSGTGQPELWTLVNLSLVCNRGIF